MDYIQRLDELRAVHKEIESLQRKENMLSKAVISNMSDVEKLCVRCKEFFLATSTPFNRRALLYALLIFVSPQTLIGLRVRKGLRKMLCAILYGNTNPSVVSCDINNAIFCFKHYNDFQEKTYLLISKIEQIIERDFHIKV